MTPTLTVTARERAVLDCIARNCYAPCNYGRPDTFEGDVAPIWSRDILESGSALASTIAPRSLPGICSSLSKKGLVWANAGKPRNEDVICLTELGFAVWLREFPADVSA